MTTSKLELPLPAELTMTLRYLRGRTDSGWPTHPTDMADDLKGVNVRYARELLGLAVTNGCAQMVETDGGDAWVITGTGRQALDTQSRRVVELSQQGGQTARKPKEPTMSKTATAPKPNATNPDARYCGCGCGNQVAGKALFRQGHDARMISQLTALVVGADAGSRRNKQVAPVAPAPFTKAQADHAAGSSDIQDRIDQAADAVKAHFGAVLAAKAHTAMMNGWNRENDRNTNASTKAAAKAARAAQSTAKVQTVSAKVGRWIKEGTVKGGRFTYTDAKGREVTVEKGKYEIQK